MQLGGGEEGVVTSLRWQTDIKDLQLDIITIDLTTEPLDMGFYLTMSLEPSPRSGLDVDLVWTQLPHSLDTQSTPHPQTLVCACRLDIDSDSDGLQRKGGPYGSGRGILHGRRKGLLTEG
jgi:hypothetical protein